MNNSFISKTKVLRLSLAFLFVFLGLMPASFAQTESQTLNIIPAPVSEKNLPGEFVFSKLTTIKADDPSGKAAKFLLNYIKDELNIKSLIAKNSSKKIKYSNAIVLTQSGASELPIDGYRLTITPHQIIIAGKDAGLFYGIQTLIQLLPASKIGVAKLPCTVIEDYPRFGYRGLMLDVSRHFFTAEYVKKLISIMAAYKLNTFHWHLVDDEGWRVEIKKYPKLTQTGDYYTQDQIRDVIKYAADRYITVIPEIEMPAHSMAALAAYPELRCKADSGNYYKRYYNYLYCPTEETFTFLENILTEVMSVFPSEYIHIGGDEAFKLPWKESAFCQQLIKEKNLKNEEGIQSYFIERIEKFLNSKGHRIIGWDEILEGGLAPNATVMSWRGEKGGIAAAKQKHQVIMTPSTHGLYFDFYQSTSDMEPSGFGYSTIKNTYDYDPVPPSLSPDEKKYVIGVQANIWTENIETPALVDYMTLPRLFALSEIAWSPVSRKNYANFSERLPQQLARLDAKGIDYRVPTAIGVPLDTAMIGNEFIFALKPTVTGAKIYYTLNGKSPGDTDWEYTSPIKVSVPAGQNRELKTIVITPTGRRSVVTNATIFNRQLLLPAVNYTDNKPGIRYKLFKEKFKTAEQLDYAPVTDSGIVKDISVKDFNKNNPFFGIEYMGYMLINTDDNYMFSLGSADGAQLFIDNEKIIDNDKPWLMFEKSTVIPLAKGFHKFEIKYFDAGLSTQFWIANKLNIAFGEIGKPQKEIPKDSLFY